MQISEVDLGASETSTQTRVLAGILDLDDECGTGIMQ